jgi:hypothetical protein
MMQLMAGEPAFTRRDDIAIWGLLCWVAPQVDFALAINDKRL